MTRKKKPASWLPERLVIMGTTWTVVQCADINAVDVTQTELHWGNCNPVTREIRIFTGSQPFDVYQTLLHEVFHCVAGELQLKFNRNEAEVDVFSRTVVDTLVRNGMLKLPEANP